MPVMGGSCGRPHMSTREKFLIDLLYSRAKSVPVGTHLDSEADYQARALRSRAVVAGRAPLGRDFWT